MSDDQIDELYEKVCDVEIEEALDHGDDPWYPRLEMAADIVDYIYNNFIA